jgi:hypothetical protein
MKPDIALCWQELKETVHALAYSVFAISGKNSLVLLPTASHSFPTILYLLSSLWFLKVKSELLLFSSAYLFIDKFNLFFL